MSDKTEQVCENCGTRQDGDYCVQWLGEACGWQWFPKNKENKCKSWIEMTE